MTYTLFLDDLRDPAITYPDADVSCWIVCRNYEEAVASVIVNGAPSMILFDHDLGDGPTGLDFAKWLIDQHLDGNHAIPAGFDYYVHSMNPIGAENIRQLLKNFLENVEL